SIYGGGIVCRPGHPVSTAVSADELIALAPVIPTARVATCRPLHIFGQPEVAAVRLGLHALISSPGRAFAIDRHDRRRQGGHGALERGRIRVSTTWVPGTGLLDIRGVSQLFPGPPLELFQRCTLRSLTGRARATLLICRHDRRRQG